MVVSLVPTGYRLDVTPAEREQLVACLEFSIGLLAGDRAALPIAADLDRRALDALADRLFLAGLKPVA